jgi:hypothetical protein
MGSHGPVNNEDRHSLGSGCFVLFDLAAIVGVAGLFLAIVLAEPAAVGGVEFDIPLCVV